MMPGTMEYYDKAAAEWAERGYPAIVIPKEYTDAIISAFCKDAGAGGGGAGGNKFFF